MVETTEGNGADQPRRARSSTERARRFRAKKKAEREAVLQKEREAALKAEAERVAEAVASVANAVASAAPGPTQPKVERSAAALHEAERTEREADATETATIGRVAGRVADVAYTVAPFENAVAPLKPPEWRTVERPVWHPTVPIWPASPSVAHPVERPVKRHGWSHGLWDWTMLLTALARILVAAVLFLAALDLGGSGLIMNARYAASLGSGEGATVQAMIAIAIDAIALVLLSAGYLLWNRGHRRLAVIRGSSGRSCSPCP
jgi:hypothetical protein